MSDSKVFMFPDGGQSTANSMLPLMAMNGGGFGNGAWNNPFIYLVWMMFANRFFGNGYGEGTQTEEVQNQLSAIREQMNNNQNSNLLMDAIKGNASAIGQLAGQLNCDFNTLNSAICDVRGGIDRLAGAVGLSSERVINAVQSGDASLASQLASCCCTVREAITTQGYENQLATLNQTNVLQSAINTVATGQERGFSSVAYETQKQTCDLQNSIKDATATIVAGQRAAEMRELNREIAERDRKIAEQATALNNSQQTGIFSQMISAATAPLATALASLQSDVNGVKCKLPETVSVQWPNLTAVPSYFTNGLYGLGWGNWSNWSTNSLWG